MSKSITVTTHHKVTFGVQDLLDILNARMSECHDYHPTDVVSFAVLLNKYFLSKSKRDVIDVQSVKLTMKDGLSFIVSLGAPVKSDVSSHTTTEALEEHYTPLSNRYVTHTPPPKVVSTSTDGTGSFE